MRLVLVFEIEQLRTYTRCTRAKCGHEASPTPARTGQDHAAAQLGRSGCGCVHLIHTNTAKGAETTTRAIERQNVARELRIAALFVALLTAASALRNERSSA